MKFPFQNRQEEKHLDVCLKYRETKSIAETVEWLYNQVLGLSGINWPWTHEKTFPRGMNLNIYLDFEDTTIRNDIALSLTQMITDKLSQTCQTAYLRMDLMRHGFFKLIPPSTKNPPAKNFFPVIFSTKECLERLHHEELPNNVYQPFIDRCGYYGCVFIVDNIIKDKPEHSLMKFQFHEHQEEDRIDVGALQNEIKDGAKTTAWVAGTIVTVAGVRHQWFLDEKPDKSPADLIIYLDTHETLDLIVFPAFLISEMARTFYMNCQYAHLTMKSSEDSPGVITLADRPSYASESDKPLYPVFVCTDKIWKRFQDNPVIDTAGSNKHKDFLTEGQDLSRIFIVINENKHKKHKEPIVTEQNPTTVSQIGIKEFQTWQAFQNECFIKLNEAAERGKHGWDDPEVCPLSDLVNGLVRQLTNPLLSYPDIVNYLVMLSTRHLNVDQTESFHDQLRLALQDKTAKEEDPNDLPRNQLLHNNSHEKVYIKGLDEIMKEEPQSNSDVIPEQIEDELYFGCKGLKDIKDRTVMEVKLTELPKGMTLLEWFKKCIEYGLFHRKTNNIIRVFDLTQIKPVESNIVETIANEKNFPARISWTMDQYHPTHNEAVTNRADMCFYKNNTLNPDDLIFRAHFHHASDPVFKADCFPTKTCPMDIFVFADDVQLANPFSKR